MIEQPPILDTLPRMIQPRSSAEFLSLCNRAKKGEFKIVSLRSLRTKSGDNNGAWEFCVQYPDKNVDAESVA